MTRSEEGVLLLCCPLGDPRSRPLTMAQFRELGLRVRASQPQRDGLEELNIRDLTALGYREEDAARIISLLDREDTMRRYVAAGERLGIYPITRLSPDYPARIAAKRKLDSPPVLFCRGDRTLLETETVAVVGSRALRHENRKFAAKAGELAALEGFILVSGGCRGADLTAQRACQRAGGHAVVFVPDQLMDHPADSNVLYLSADGFDLPFTTPRALGRNCLIHMEGDRVLVPQCTHGSGGTWQGSTENLTHQWSPLFVYDDGSAGAKALMELGATGITRFVNIASLTEDQQTLL